MFSLFSRILRYIDAHTLFGKLDTKNGLIRICHVSQFCFRKFKTVLDSFLLECVQLSIVSCIFWLSVWEMKVRDRFRNLNPYCCDEIIVLVDERELSKKWKYLYSVHSNFQVKNIREIVFWIYVRFLKKISCTICWYT